LARQAGVDVSTVSRSLAADPRISAVRTAEVRRLARRLGYTPKPLRRKRAGAIGLIIAAQNPGLADDFFQQQVILAAERYATERKNHVHVQFIPREPRKPVWPALLAERRVDGVFLAGHPPVDLCRKIRERGIPAVVACDVAERTGCCSVLMDSTEAIALAVHRLIDLGHRRIGMVLTRHEFPSVETRYRGYRQALAGAGIELDDRLVLTGLEPNVLGGRTAVTQYLETRELPAAILFTNDWMALGAMNELSLRGLRVPDDVSLIGHDNVSLCDELKPRLTSIDGSVDAMVARALDLLVRQIDGEAVPDQDTLTATLVWRDSCDRPKGMA